MSHPVNVQTLKVGDVVGCSGGDGTRAIAKVVSVNNRWLSAEVLRCDSCREKCEHAGTHVGCAVPASGMGGIHFWRVPDYVDRYGTPPWDPAPAWLDAPDGEGHWWVRDPLGRDFVCRVWRDDLGALLVGTMRVEDEAGQWQRVAPPREDA